MSPPPPPRPTPSSPKAEPALAPGPLPPLAPLASVSASSAVAPSSVVLLPPPPQQQQSHQQQQQQQQTPLPVSLPDAKQREKKRSYTVEEKLAIVQAAKTESLRAVARRFNVDRNCIRAWREKEAQLAGLHPNARRLPGAGRRPSTETGVARANKRKAEQLRLQEVQLQQHLQQQHHQPDDALAAATASEEDDDDRMAAMAAAGLDIGMSSGARKQRTPTSAAIGGNSTMLPGTSMAPLMATPLSSASSPPPQPPHDFLLVGFQGKEGAFSDVAARQAFDALKRAKAISPPEYETVGYSQVSTVIAALTRGEVEYGVLPIENSISGTFHGILDQLIASELKIVGEIACVQELCLCALPEARSEDITCLLSHPAILDHCQDFITDLEKKNRQYVDRQATWDSAGACHMVKHEGDKHVAAIASEQAAATHGLQVLEKGVGDELHNETRYAIVARREIAPLLVATGSVASTIKSSVVIAVPNEPQALFKIVAAFALRNLTIIKIESRPASTAGGLFNAQTHHWDYIFFVDYIVSADAAVNERLMKNLEEFALWVKDLGTYTSSAATKTNVEPPRWKTLCNVISC